MMVKVAKNIFSKEMQIVAHTNAGTLLKRCHAIQSTNLSRTKDVRDKKD